MRRLACRAFTQQMNIDVPKEYPQERISLQVMCRVASPTAWCTFLNFILGHTWLNQFQQGAYQPPLQRMQNVHENKAGYVTGILRKTVAHKETCTTAETPARSAEPSAVAACAKRSREYSGVRNRDTKKNSCTQRNLHHSRVPSSTLLLRTSPL